MNRQTLKLALLAVLLGLALGMLVPRVMKGEWREWLKEEEPTITRLEGDLKTDEFSVRLLQTALQTQDYPTTFVCPSAMTKALLMLDEMSTGDTHTQIEALRLCMLGQESETSYALAAMEEGLQRAEGPHPILLLPFRRSYPEAVSTFNTVFGYPAADSSNSSPETRLFMALRTQLRLHFHLPFYEEDGTNADFDNADGGMPSVRMMRRCGTFRTAESKDCAWKAVALLCKGAAVAETGATAFIAVLPQGSAREFAMQLTPEQLSDIRRALAEATPQECTVVLPKFNLSVGLRTIAPLWNALGVTAPFDIRKAEFSALTTEKVALNAVAESFHLVMDEDSRKPADVPAPASSSQTFSLTRPFLWMVGDLTSPCPPVMFGIVENL